MTSLNLKTTFSEKLSWISYTKNYEIQQKRAFRPTYANLFAYGANNPVHYIDPDGRLSEDAVPLSSEQKNLVNLAQKEAMNNINEFLAQLNSYDGSNSDFRKSVLNIIGYDINKASDMKQLKESIKKISMSLSEMTANDYKFDPKPISADTRAYVETNESIVLYGQSQFNKVIYITSSGFDKSLSKTLIHESAHKALNLTTSKEYYGMSKVLELTTQERRQNADSWALLLSGRKK